MSKSKNGYLNFIKAGQSNKLLRFIKIIYKSTLFLIISNRREKKSFFLQLQITLG